MSLLALLVLVLLVLAAAPTWLHSRGSGDHPSGLFGTLPLVGVVLDPMGRS